MEAYAKWQEEAHGQRDAQRVVYAGPYEVATDSREDSAGEVERCDNVEEVRTHKYDVGGLDSDRGPRGERDADGSGH